MLKGHVLPLQTMISLRLLSMFSGNASPATIIDAKPARLREHMLRTAIRGAFAGLLMTAALGVCPAQIPFFSPSNASAKAVKLIGQVSVLKDLRDSYSWALVEGAIIQP